MNAFDMNALSPELREFASVFLSRGWKGVERTFGNSNDVLLKKIAACGGPALLQERARRQKCGRKAGS